MIYKSCATCGYLIGDKLCNEECGRGFTGWKLKEGAKINGVASDEKVSNELGGKQSKLEYRFDLIDTIAIFQLANVLHRGEVEYGKDNWRKIDTESHLNHALSHIYAYLAGDTQDNHLSHAFCRLMMSIGVERGDT